MKNKIYKKLMGAINFLSTKELGFILLEICGDEWEPKRLKMKDAIVSFYIDTRRYKDYNPEILNHKKDFVKWLKSF